MPPQPMQGAPMGMAPKDIRAANGALYTKQLEYQKTQMPQDLQMAKNTLGVIDKMLGDTTVDAKGKLNYKITGPDGKLVKGRETAPGFGSFVGAGVPFLSKLDGTDAADFRAMYEQVNSKAFLEAYSRLKGGGQITEIEGTKATQALLRAKSSQSEPEFVAAMREFEQEVKTGMENAQRKGMVQVTSAPPMNNQPPATPSAKKMPRYNPQTKSWE